ncbi:phosphotransferase family protein [Actinacidiphila acidipaludis]|uniref:Phosphotransferase n=1 Tax=Actinacidiphila acidipaludis TaxID=2873382 RepID=A0ABS7Q6N4_9ACTN|nr:phosphotransferase [Streptomyces acidipaludis]MBY8878799.1 phosphotransferase [Streptomyces acidipaludis]
MTVADERISTFLARAAAAGAREAGAGAVRRVTALTGGTYNGLYAVELDGGERLVLKVPPPFGRPRLTYERELLYGEALFHRSAVGAGVPAPRVVHAEPAEGPGREPYLLMTHVDGVPWWDVAEGMAAAERDRLRTGLGALVARLHAVTGPGFGYPAPGGIPRAPRWSAAFTAMTGAVLDDAERYGSWLPLPVPEVRARLAAAREVLDEVTVPALVHFDLWPGNVLLDGPEGERTISGIIDGERMFWGDPLADFASLSLFLGDAESDPAFLAGYRAAGGTADLDGPAALRRIALYRCYLYLIMLTEAVPRGYDAEHTAWVRDFAAPRLEAALASAG